ncbi:hypothetical protein [Amycolatopsis sp. NPDC051716]|uniref:hypothetical protein n=1 Tax=Amycolatopsis sp. NPDC051716 TaxID=3155804 RepID=UPI0034497903
MEEMPAWKVKLVRVVVWVLFGVIFGLLPVIIAAFRDSVSPEGLNLDKMLGSGELLIVGAVIAAGATGELFASSRRRSTDGIVANLMWIFAGFAVIAAFAADTILYLIAVGPSHSAMTSLSLIFFSATVVGTTIAVGTAA